MTKDQMRAIYNSIRREGKITFDSNDGIVRLLRIVYNGETWQIALYAGEVFAITQVTE